jgi:D-alanyl-D-alanine carboxypeptidase/D-alanyl-D-alanine-endopeptidase (penicillin-binding protein 4)
MSRPWGSTGRGAAVALATLAVALPIAAGPLAPAAPASAAGVRAAALAVSTPGSGAVGPTTAHAATRSRVPTATANTRISTVLRSRTTSKVLGQRFTMTVWDTATSSYVFSKRARASVRGASTTKVLTAVGALAALGPEHRFPTTVRAGAAPGEVVLVAGGDPLLTSADLQALAARTASALGAPAAQAGPASAPAVPAITVRADDSLFADQGLRSRGWRSSYVPRDVRLVGAFARDDRKVRDATADAGAYFAAELRALGLSAEYAGEAAASPGSATLAAIAGHSVAEAVSRTLLISDNDTAEMLFRHVAAARGLPTTWAGARRALADTLRELAIPLEGVRIVDGSGLSLDGRLTARALTSALNRALSPNHPRLAGLRGWLPVAGRTGTLRTADRRFASRPSSCAAGLIQAKTGTVADAIALAGYAQGADGRTKIFVSIVNSRPTRYSRLTTRRYVDRTASSVTGCW